MGCPAIGRMTPTGLAMAEQSCTSGLPGAAAPAPAAHVLLHTLPLGHDLRVRPLLGAQCRNLQSKEWRNIGPSWGIAGVSFDELGQSWKDTTEFRREIDATTTSSTIEAQA